MRGASGGPFPPLLFETFFLRRSILSHSTEPTVVVQKAYDWTLWIIPKVQKFPKSFQISIGHRLVDASIELQMNLVDATYQVRNAGSLGAAVREVNRIRYLMRLAKDLRVVNIAAYEFASKAHPTEPRPLGSGL